MRVTEELGLCAWISRMKKSNVDGRRLALNDWWHRPFRNLGMTAGLSPLVPISPPSEGASRDVRVANAIHRLTSLLVQFVTCPRASVPLSRESGSAVILFPLSFSRFFPKFLRGSRGTRRMATIRGTGDGQLLNSPTYTVAQR